MMDKPGQTKRTYNSSRRRKQATETRRQIIDSARSLFIERGYAGTTIDAIAQAAGVASETVYAVFGSKRKILSHLLDVSVVGDEQPTHLLERPEQQAVLHETEPVRQLAMFSRGITAILTRTAPLFEVMRATGKSDTEIAELLQSRLQNRLKNMTTLAEHMARSGNLREDLTIPAAADLIWAVTSPEVFLLLTRDRQYTSEQYIAWLQTNLMRLLLP